MSPDRKRFKYSQCDDYEIWCARCEGHLQQSYEASTSQSSTQDSTSYTEPSITKEVRSSSLASTDESFCSLPPYQSPHLIEIEPTVLSESTPLKKKQRNIELSEETMSDTSDSTSIADISDIGSLLDIQYYLDRHFYSKSNEVELSDDRITNSEGRIEASKEESIDRIEPAVALDGDRNDSKSDDDIFNCPMSYYVSY